jgi:hypothetical protein
VTVSVLLRNSSNTGFDPSINIATGSGYQSGYGSGTIAVGDFNGDGKADFAAPSDAGGADSHIVSVWLRSADNTSFNTELNYDTGGAGFSDIATGDFNGDGKLDLAVSSVNSSDISILLRNATNTGFDTAVKYDGGISQCSIKTADFNGDGKLDMACADIRGISILLRNTANSGFDSVTRYSTMDESYNYINPNIDVGDFNGDGKADIAKISSSGRLWVLTRNSDNTGFEITKFLSPATTDGVYSPVAKDINKDGKIDVAIYQNNVDLNAGGALSVLLNNSTSSSILTIAENTPPTGTVTINDTTPTQNQTLTATNTLADLDGLGAITYQWKAGGVNVGTGANYIAKAADVGKQISVVASYTDGLGNAESKASVLTSAVIAAANPGFTITGTDYTTGENGNTAQFSIKLNTAPAAGQNVVLTFASSDTSEGVVANPTLTFTSTNYNTAQTLTVRGVDDYLNDGSVPYQVSATVNTIDVNYKALTITPFNLSPIPMTDATHQWIGTATKPVQQLTLKQAWTARTNCTA